MSESIELKDFIRNIPDWPEKGILFRDITPLLSSAEAFKCAVEALCADFSDIGVDYVAAVEARGFIFGSVVAEKLGAGFIPIRKEGKLPAKTERATYDLEYGSDTLEVHSDAVSKGDKILMIDDLLATGGTMSAACELIEKIGGTISGISFLIELTNLKGRAKLQNYNIKTVMRY